MELKPCPFCEDGGTSYMDFTDNELANCNSFWGSCRDCHTSGPLCDTVEEAVSGWNTRSFDETVTIQRVTEIKKLRDKLAAVEAENELLRFALSKHTAEPIVFTTGGIVGEESK